jgi:predicted transcriptional regulator of viral defense system
MEFEQLLVIVGEEPVFETGLLLAGDVEANHVRRQLTRWTKAGRLFQLRRGLYSLAPPYQKAKPHPFVIANRMVPGSYVSCQSALAHHAVIPEYAPSVISVCVDRPRQWDTPLGSYRFRHIQRGYLFGYELLELGGGQQALVAEPEKALLDLIYLAPGGDSEVYLRSLRLQNLQQLDEGVLGDLAGGFRKPKLMRTADQVATWIRDERSGGVRE